jgi:hypothetical protein
LNFWKNTYDGIFKDKEAIKNTFIDVASYFFNKGFPNKFQKDTKDTKEYYNPSTKIVSHNINLPITYYDLCSVNKRKLRILLKNVKEPVYITLCCKKDYPCLTRQYIDDDSIEHEIIINMVIDNTSDDSDGSDSGDGYCDSGEDADDIKYTHSITGINNEIDLHTTIYINILEYLIGGVKSIKYVDDTLLDIVIEPFSTKDISIKNKGLLGGNLNIKVVFKNITLKDWKKISEKRRAKVIKLITKMYAKSVK